jgi:heme/copper-type cytochrome/quinol oxidase subunit 2
MRFDLIRYWCVSALLVALPGRQADHQAVQIIQLTARKYEFSPSEVHVKLGTKVQLKIIAIDRDHGFTIVRDPAGDNCSPHPGLAFTLAADGDDWRLKRGKETVIEFIARVPGTYGFSCSLVCGLHHGRMKGQLIVDP